jgi:rhodanese-related sulfurtransferase
MEIGLFQLENLMHSHVRFKLFDLRVKTQTLPDAIEAILSRGIRPSVKSVEEILKDEKADKTAPVILVCEAGRVSAQTAAQLEASGYQNVYVVEGGVAGLLSEL